MTERSAPYDPISFNHTPGGPTFASYTFRNGNVYVGEGGAGDQAALRRLVHHLAEHIEELERDRTPRILSTVELTEKSATQRAVEAALAAENATEEGCWKEARNYVRLADTWARVAELINLGPDPL